MNQNSKLTAGEAFKAKKQKERRELMQTWGEYQTVTNDRKAEIEQMRNERDAAVKEREEVLANAEPARLEIERLNKELVNERVAMDQQAQTARTEQMESTRHIDQLQSKNQQLTIEKQSLVTENIKLKQSLASEQTKNKRLSSELNSVRSDVKQLKQQKHQLKQELELMHSYREQREAEVLTELQRRADLERARLDQEAKELEAPIASGDLDAERKRSQKHLKHILGHLHAEVNTEKRVLVSRLATLVNSSFAGAGVQELLNRERESVMKLAQQSQDSGSVLELFKALKALRKLLQFVQAKQRISELITRGDYFDLLRDFENTKLRKPDNLTHENLQSEMQRFLQRKIEEEENKFSQSDKAQLQKEIRNRAADLSFNEDFIKAIILCFPNLSSSDQVKLENTIIRYIMAAGIDVKTFERDLSTIKADMNENLKHVLIEHINMMLSENLSEECQINKNVVEMDMDRSANLLNAIITADEISAKETLDLYHKEVEEARKGMLLKTGTYVQPQLIVNVVSDTEYNDTQFHFKKGTSLQVKQDTIKKLEAQYGDKYVPNTHGLDEPIFKLDPVKTQALLENRCGKMLAKLQIVAVSLGKYGLDCITAKNKQECNRVYSSDGSVKEPGFIPMSDFGYVQRGIEKYFTPIGWCRWAINVGLDESQFEQKYSNWPVAFHGTKKAENVMKILQQGFQPGRGCYIEPNENAVYVTPSVNYAAVYAAAPHKHGGRNVQFVLQLRVKPNTYSKEFGTLEVDPNVQFDKNINNSELIWVIKSQQNENVLCQNENDQQKENGLLLYGIMLRFT